MAKQKTKPIVAAGPVDPDQIEILPGDFERKINAEEIKTDANFASQNYWKDVRRRFVSNKGALVGLVLILLIALMAIVGPGMNAYTYSGQTLSEKNLAPRVPGLESVGILDGSEKMSTTTGTKEVNYYQEKELDDTYYWFGSDTLVHG